MFFFLFVDLEGCKQEGGESRIIKLIEFDEFEDLLIFFIGFIDIIIKVFKCFKCIFQFYFILKLYFYFVIKYYIFLRKILLGKEIGYFVEILCFVCGKMFFNIKILKFYKYICFLKLLKLKLRWRKFNNYYCYRLYINFLRNLYQNEIKKYFLGNGCICG